jgi:hypothetical protein
MRAPPALAVALVLAVASSARAQVPHPLPPHIHGTIALPGAPPARFVNVTVTLGANEWAIEGCVSSGARTCRATRIVLDDAARRELVTAIEAIHSMPRCEPEGFAPGDPAYTLETPAVTWSGHLPRDASQVAARTTGPCAACTALAWWIVRRFGVPGLTAPQGGGP